MILVIESVILCAAFTLMIYFLSIEGIKNPAFRIFGRTHTHTLPPAGGCPEASPEAGS